MSPVDARRLRLIAELQRDWQQVCSHCDKSLSVEPDDSEPAAALVALSLDHAYAAP